VAHPAVVTALTEAATGLGQRAHTGIIRSTDALYADLAPHGMPLQALYQGTSNEMWARGNVLCGEMEAAALFVVSSIRGLRAGCLLLVVNATGEGAIESTGVPSLDPLIATAAEALRLLIARDQTSQAASSTDSPA